MTALSGSSNHPLGRPRLLRSDRVTVQRAGHHLRTSGTVMEPEADGRWRVRLDDDGESVTVDSADLVAIPRPATREQLSDLPPLVPRLARTMPTGTTFYLTKDGSFGDIFVFFHGFGAEADPATGKMVQTLVYSGALTYRTTLRADVTVYCLERLPNR
jgi:hypothetical protein